MEGKESRSRRRTALRRKALRWMGRTLRWGTLALAVFFAVVWAGGERTHYQRTFTAKAFEVAIYARWGGVMVIYQDSSETTTMWGTRSSHVSLSPRFEPNLSDDSMLTDPVYERARDRLWARHRLDLEMCAVHARARYGLWLPRVFSRPAHAKSVLQVPYWLITAMLTSISGVLFLFSYLRSRRAKAGHCTACNYSLAGLSSTAACPECGLARVGTEVSPLAGPS